MSGAISTIGWVAIIWHVICLTGAIRGRIEHRPSALVAGALFMIAAAIAFK